MPHRLLPLLVAYLLAGCADSASDVDATKTDEARNEIQAKAQAAEDAITNLLTATEMPQVDNNQMDSLPDTIDTDLNAINENSIDAESNEIAGNSSVPN